MNSSAVQFVIDTSGGRISLFGEFVQSLGGILQQAVTYRTLAIDEPSDGALVNSQTPGERRGAPKQLDTVGEMVLSILHLPFIAVPVR
jgi:hypothetical protein